MNELESLRQEAETLKNAIRVSTLSVYVCRACKGVGLQRALILTAAGLVTHAHIFRLMKCVAEKVYRMTVPYRAPAELRVGTPPHSRAFRRACVLRPNHNISQNQNDLCISKDIVNGTRRAVAPIPLPDHINYVVQK